MLHAYLVGRYAAVSREHKVPIRKKVRAIDFRFGDKPHGTNPCLFELAVRNSENGSQLLCSQNRRELEKLARYPLTRANTRILLLLDLGHDPIKQGKLQPGYDEHSLNLGDQIGTRSISVLYVHRDLIYRFVWRPLGRRSN